MGRGDSSVSSVAVPEATSAASAAIGPARAWPSRAAARCAAPPAAACAREYVAHRARRHRRDELHCRPLRRSHAAARRKSSPRRGTSPRRLPGSSAMTVRAAGDLKRAPRGAAIRIERDLIGQRMADECARTPWLRRSSVSNGSRHSTRSQSRRDACARVPAARPTPAGSRTAPWECPRARSCASSPILNAGASMPTNTCGRAATKRATSRRRSANSRGRCASGSIKPHDRKFVGVRPRLAARGAHPRACDAEGTRPRHARAQRHRAMRRPACPRRIRPATRPIASGAGGALARRGAQRTRLRVEVSMKSSNGRTSGCVPASASAAPPHRPASGRSGTGCERRCAGCGSVRR